MLNLPEIPEWDGEPQELYPVPESAEVAGGGNVTARTAYDLARVIEEAGMYDPDFLDSLPL